METIFDQVESSVRSYCRAFPVVFDRGEGAWLYTETGKKYLDFFSAAGSLNYGHNPTPLIERLLEYIKRGGVVNSLDMHTWAKAEFLTSFYARVLEPRGMKYKTQFTGPTGTNAVEAAVKLARKVTGRRSVVAFTNAYHGLSLGSLALTGNQHYRGVAGSDLANAVFMPFEGYLGKDIDTLDLFDAMLRDKSSGLDLPAAVIIETIQAEGGVNIASSSWLKRLQGLCREFSIPFIVDDIQVGCGRAGKFFTSEIYGIEPDMIVLSKSISGIGLPMSIVLVKSELDQWNPGEHTGTFRGNNLAFVTATAAIDNYWSDYSFSDEIAKRETLMRSYLSELMRSVGDERIAYRGSGMIWAIEFLLKPELAKQVSAEVFAKGVIVETCGGRKQSLKLLPSLTISEGDLLQGMEKIGEAIQSVLRGGAR